MGCTDSINDIVESLPTPVGITFLAFAQETSAFTKLHRLIDVYEITLRLLAAIFVQNFYFCGLEKEFPEIDLKIRERLSRPTTGDWMMFLREASSCFGKRKDLLILPEAATIDLETIADKLGSLRNQIRHGATVEAAVASALVQTHLAYLESMLAEFNKLGPPHLVYASGLNADATTRIEKLVGLSGDSSEEQTLPIALPTGHVVLVDRGGSRFIDLYPFVIFDTTRLPGKRCLFFNSISKKAADFLDYTSGDHVAIDSPSSLPDDFRRRFPRPTIQQSAEGPNWFGQFIDASTQHFVGREDELARLDQFCETCVEPNLPEWLR